ncbi:MAG: PTS sugar transporter subunit IIA, partial [bacterium]|nr:PTS sugar transporter subunit IIA [bacterium]
MNLANLLMDRRICIDLKSTNKDDAMQELLRLLQSEGVRLDYEAVMSSIREREEIESTSYGHGFTFPHARTDSVSELYILIGIARQGLEDKTPDGIPVHVVCLLLTPSTIAKLYLQTLSGLAAFARDDRNLEQVLNISSPADL